MQKFIISAGLRYEENKGKKMEKKKAAAGECIDRIIKLWDKNWLLLTAGDFAKGDFNAMTGQFWRHVGQAVFAGCGAADAIYI